MRTGLPKVAAAGATSSRIQRATASAIGQRSVAAGVSAMRRPSLSTTASKRTISSAPQEPGPLIEASGWISAISVVRPSWQAEGAFGVVAAAASAGGAAIAPKPKATTISGFQDGFMPAQQAG